MLFSYSISVAEKAKSNIIKYSPKHCTDYLSNTNANILPLTPTNKSLLILLLDSHKPSGPNSIPLKTLILLKNDIFQKLKDIFNVF